jgi:formylglycine-generating enzyme required for sulfatase activity
VSWTDAEAYVDWLSRRTGNDYRLLSSSEWEYVARAGAKTPNSWSDDPAASCQLANVADRSAQNAYPGWEAYSCSDSYIYTAPVASFQPNNFGVYGMLGNVFEWVEDCWNDSYNGAPGDGSAWMSGDCGERQLRGGSWFSRPRYVRFAFRNHFTRESRASTFGFRVARVLGGS